MIEESINKMRECFETKACACYKELYKLLILKHHPDKGGKKEDFQQLHNEYIIGLY